jgi:hypothetical protein
MKDLLKFKGKLSAPGLDKFMNQKVKFVRDSTTEMIVEVMTKIINSHQFLEEWRDARTILNF